MSCEILQFPQLYSPDYGPIVMKKGKTTINLYILCLCTVLLFAGGCFQKKTVTYIPLEQRQSRPAAPEKLQQERIAALQEHYFSWQGVRYAWGGTTLKGVDCSGFTMLTYRKIFDTALPRTVAEQIVDGVAVPRTSLQPGDLVFFKTGMLNRHVGIFFKDDLFIHASEKRGVTLDSLDAPYWSRRFVKARHLL